MTTLGTSQNERPVFFEGDGEMLFGIFSEPTGDAKGIAVIAVPGGGWIPSTHRNGMWVRLARALAADGYHMLRFDWHGVGESSGYLEHYELSEPFTGDIAAAVEFLVAQGIDRIVLVGTCFGGRTVNASTAHVTNLIGLAMFSAPLRDKPKAEDLQKRSIVWFIKQALQPKVIKGLFEKRRRRTYMRLLKLKTQSIINKVLRRSNTRATTSRRPQIASTAYLQPLEDVTALGLPILLVYGDGDDYYEDFVNARDRGQLGEIMERAGDKMTSIVVPGDLHSFASLDAQDLTVRTVREWLAATY